MAEQTPGAIKAAHIILNERKFIQTGYGRKTEVGIADLIDIETQAPEMLARLRSLEHLASVLNARQHAGMKITPAMWSELYRNCEKARAAISAAEGK